MDAGQPRHECQGCGQQVLPGQFLNDELLCDRCAREREEQTEPMNPIDMHALTADLIQPGLTMFDPVPRDAMPAISFAPVEANRQPDNSEMQDPITEGNQGDEEPEDMEGSPTPEQMWGHGGLASALEDTSFNDTQPMNEAAGGCSPTQRMLVLAETNEQDENALSFVGDIDESEGDALTPSSAGGNPAEPKVKVDAASEERSTGVPQPRAPPTSGPHSDDEAEQFWDASEHYYGGAAAVVVPDQDTCSRSSTAALPEAAPVPQPQFEELSDYPPPVPEVAVPDSDESDASIFGLRHTSHEVEEFEELSDVSSQGSDEISIAGREKVCRWRRDNLLLNDQDFAYVYVTFDEAYSNAGRAVAMAWSRSRVLAEPKSDQ